MIREDKKNLRLKKEGSQWRVWLKNATLLLLLEAICPKASYSDTLTLDNTGKNKDYKQWSYSQNLTSLLHPKRRTKRGEKKVKGHLTDTGASSSPRGPKSELTDSQRDKYIRPALAFSSPPLPVNCLSKPISQSGQSLLNISMKRRFPTSKWIITEKDFWQILVL